MPTRAKRPVFPLLRRALHGSLLRGRLSRAWQLPGPLGTAGHYPLGTKKCDLVLVFSEDTIRLRRRFSRN